jgi:hypothetical protein
MVNRALSSSPGRHAVSAALVLAALACSSGGRAAPSDPGPAVRAVLSDERYRFCHEADYPLSADEHAWCPVLTESSDVCPSLARACAAPPVAASAGPRTPRRPDEKPPETKPDEPTAPPPPQGDTRPRPAPDSVAVAPSLSLASRVLFIGVIVAFLFVVGRAIARSFFRGAGSEPVPDDAAPAPAAKAEAPIARGPVETDVDRLLARARAAGARGEYARAIDDAYAALLRRLDADGAIDIHPSRTNGDYVRQLRDRAVRAAMRDVVREVEQVQFGATAPSERAFRAVLDRVVPLVSRALVVALFCLGASAVVACSPLGVESTRTESVGASPSGSQALFEVLAKNGFTVERRTAPLVTLTGAKTVLLRAATPIDATTWEHLLAWVDTGGRLVIAGVRPLPPQLHLAIGATTLPGTVLTIDEENGLVRGSAELHVPPGPALLDAADGADDGYSRNEPLLMRGDATYAVSFNRGAGRLVVLADDRLFTNAALLAPGNAGFLVQLLQSFPGPREIELTDGWTGVGASTPFAAVEHANLLPVIAQLFALLALLYLWKGTPFARLRDPPAETRRAFVDHARALGLAYGRARASKHVLGLYASWALDRLRERVQRGGRQGLVPLAEAIATRTGRSEADVMRVLVDASEAREDAAPLSTRSPPSTRFTAGNKPIRDEHAADLALMHELEGFLGATGRRHPARRSSKENPPA